MNKINRLIEQYEEALAACDAVIINAVITAGASPVKKCDGTIVVAAVLATAGIGKVKSTLTF